MIDNILEVVNNAEFADENIRKKVGIYLCHRYSGAKLKDIGSYFEMKDAAVSQASKRFAQQIEKDKALKKALKRAEEKMRMSYVET